MLLYWLNRSSVPTFEVSRNPRDARRLIGARIWDFHAALSSVDVIFRSRLHIQPRVPGGCAVGC